MTQIEQIKDKIERRIEQFKEERSKVHPTTPKSVDRLSLGARIAALEEMLVFIQSLPTEQPSEDLEAEIDLYFKDDKWFSTPLGDIARHFANWQKEQIINKTCEWLRKHVLEYFDDAGVEISTFIENFMTALEDR